MVDNWLDDRGVNNVALLYYRDIQERNITKHDWDYFKNIISDCLSFNTNEANDITLIENFLHHNDDLFKAKAKNKGFFSLPINIGNSHFVSLNIDYQIKGNQIDINCFYCDSMGSVKKDIIEKFLPHIISKICDVNQKKIDDTKINLNIAYNDKKIQKDGYNCGSHAIYHALEYHQRNLPLIKKNFNNLNFYDAGKFIQKYNDHRKQNNSKLDFINKYKKDSIKIKSNITEKKVDLDNKNIINQAKGLSKALILRKNNSIFDTTSNLLNNDTISNFVEDLFKKNTTDSARYLKGFTDLFNIDDKSFINYIAIQSEEIYTFANFINKNGYCSNNPNDTFKLENQPDHEFSFYLITLKIISEYENNKIKGRKIDSKDTKNHLELLSSQKDYILKRIDDLKQNSKLDRKFKFLFDNFQNKVLLKMQHKNKANTQDNFDKNISSKPKEQDKQDHQYTKSSNKIVKQKDKNTEDRKIDIYKKDHQDIIKKGDIGLKMLPKDTLNSLKKGVESPLSQGISSLAVVPQKTKQLVPIKDVNNAYMKAIDPIKKYLNKNKSLYNIFQNKKKSSNLENVSINIKSFDNQDNSNIKDINMKIKNMSPDKAAAIITLFFDDTNFDYKKIGKAFNVNIENDKVAHSIINSLLEKGSENRSKNTYRKNLEQKDNNKNIPSIKL